MIKGVTFEKQLMTSQEFAHLTNYFYQGEMGVTKGCNVSLNASGNLVVSDGFFTIYGRLLHNIGDTIVEVPAIPSGTLYSILVFEVDLSKENTMEVFNQGAFKIVSNASSYPVLIQDNLDDNPTGIYQLEFARFENTVAGAINLQDTKKILSLSMYAKDSEFKSHLAESVSEQKLVTRDAALTGTQSITGLMGKPKKITIIANCKGLFSIGVWANGVTFTTYYHYNSTNGYSFYGTADIVRLSSDGNATTSKIQNVTNGSFDLVWTHAGAGVTGTVQMFVICEYHGGD